MSQGQGAVDWCVKPGMMTTIDRQVVGAVDAQNGKLSSGKGIT